MSRHIIASVVVILFATCALSADEKDDEKGPSFWMKQKLIYSQQILNGLALEDYDMIVENANAMKGLNKLEYFVRRKPEGYRTQLKVFQSSVDQIADAAAASNLDGATLAFTQMTISCVNCHKQLR